jgi:hypothetical protein
MPRDVPAFAVIATKMASGNVQLVFQNSLDGLNPGGAVKFVAVIPSADFTALNTTVNGGAAGATLTQVHEENDTDEVGDYATADGSGVPRLGLFYATV